MSELTTAQPGRVISVDRYLVLRRTAIDLARTEPRSVWGPASQAVDEERWLLEKELRRGATTGDRALDYALMQVMVPQDPFIDHLRECMQAFRGKPGSLFLMKREVARGYSGHRVETWDTNNILGVLNNEQEGLALEYDNLLCRLRLNTARWFMVDPYYPPTVAALPHVTEGHITIYNTSDIEDDGAGFFDAEKRMRFWIGEKDIRRELREDHIAHLAFTDALIDSLFAALKEEDRQG